MLAVVLVGRIGGPDIDHDVDGLDHHRVAVRVHHAEDLEVGRQPAGAEARDVAALRQVVEHGDLPGRDCRMVLRQADHAGAATICVVCGSRWARKSNGEVICSDLEL